MVITDSHLHLAQCGRLPVFEETEYFGAVCSHDKSEFEQSLRIAGTAPSSVHIIQGFGIHPQNPVQENAPFLESLLKTESISFIGESGFDYFTEEFKKTADLQEICWKIQLELAERYGVPLLIHCRKGIERIFADSKRLRRIKSVIFHSFPGSPMDASSLLRHGINAYFSFGKPLINGKKASLECMSRLDIDRILLETDAPFQTLKNETVTASEEILRVYRTAVSLRNISLSDLCCHIYRNFLEAYSLGGNVQLNSGQN